MLINDNIFLYGLNENGKQEIVEGSYFGEFSSLSMKNGFKVSHFPLQYNCKLKPILI